MKTKELIRQLNEADPSGELECCIGNGDIVYVDVLPSYYDGALQVIERNEDGHPVSGRRIRTGQKVLLEPMFIRDALESSSFKVEYADDADRKRYEHYDEEYRRHHKEIDIRVDRRGFCEWAFRKFQQIRPVPLGWVKRLKKAARDFYDECYAGPDNPLTPVRPGRCYHDMRDEFWEENISVEWDEYSRIKIARKPKE